MCSHLRIRGGQVMFRAAMSPAGMEVIRIGGGLILCPSYVALWAFEARESTLGVRSRLLCPLVLHSSLAANTSSLRKASVGTTTSLPRFSLCAAEALPGLNTSATELRK